MTSNEITGLTFFQMQTISFDKISNVLYVNEKMQISIDVLIKTFIINPSIQRYHLTRAKRKSIKLVDYLNTNILLKGD